MKNVLKTQDLEPAEAQKRAEASTLASTKAVQTMQRSMGTEPVGSVVSTPVGDTPANSIEDMMGKKKKALSNQLGLGK